MNPWDEHILPRLTDRALSSGAVARLRARVAADLRGEIVEIGFGSGRNVPFYPPDVRLVHAIEPSAVARRLAAGRVAASQADIDFRGLDGQDLPVESASVDAVLCTFTLCTIPDPGRALAEVRRVLRPGGAFHFLEHGLSPDARVARWQHRLNGVEQRVAGGCNLDRPIDELVGDAQLKTDWIDNAQLPGPRLIRPWGYLYLGVALSPSTS